MMDIGTAGWLYKLPAGRSKGVSWHRRFFSLRGDSLLYFCHASEASGIRLAPRGVAQLTGAEVSLRPETATADGSLRFEFSLTHGNGDTLVLAAHLASERERWVAAIQEAAAATSAASHADSVPPPQSTIQDSDTYPAASPSGQLEDDIEALQLKLQVDQAVQDCAMQAQARRRAEAALTDATAALALRRSLLHWRHHTLRVHFLVLVRASQTHLASRGHVAIDHDV